MEAGRATWDQFDLEATVWVKPAEATKTAKSDRVPLLSRQALAMLAEAWKGNRGALVFPGTRPGATMGDAVMTQALRMEGIAASAHGFRSSFRDYAAERNHTPRAVMEAALVHVARNKWSKVIGCGPRPSPARRALTVRPVRACGSRPRAR